MDEDDIQIPSIEDQASKVLTFIREEWFNVRSNWIFIGQCIYNIYGNEGQELFSRYTKSQFRSDFERIWSSYEKTRHGLASLKYLAKDTKYGKPNLYYEWMSNELIKAAYIACKPTSGMTEIADICKFMFGDQFICASVQSSLWYQFNNKHWQALDGGHTLKQKFSRELVKQFTAIKGGIENIIDPEDKDDPRRKELARCMSIIKGLKDPSFKANLMRECSETLWVQDFENECDENQYLLAFPNGVYDFKIMGFRETYPEDWVTLQCGVPYRDYYTWDHEEVKDVMLFFKKVLFDQDIIDFTLGHKATCLLGFNMDKFLVMYVGETAHNGKTTYQKLDKWAFGKYAGKLPLGVIVGKTPEAGAANPAMAATKGKRLEYIDEANKTQQINYSALKTMTGNDEFIARKLFSNGGPINPQFTLIMVVNQPPKSGSSDAAIWERFVMIPFDSRFTSSAPESVEEQWKQRLFPADPFIEEKLKKLAPAYMWVLIQYFIRYQEEGGLKKPQSVIDKTKKYQNDNDIYLQFKNAKIEHTGRNSDYIKVEDIYTQYKMWLNDNNSMIKPESSNEVIAEMTRLLKAPFEGRWLKYRMKVDIKSFGRGAEK